MGRYKKAVGSRNYCNYTNVRLEEAVRNVREGRMSQRQASEMYKIPRSTLQNKIKKVHTNPPGGQTVLTVDEERKLKFHIIAASDFGFPIDSLDLRRIVKSYLDRKGVTIRKFTDNMPGSEWVRLFLKRHRDLTQRFASNIKVARATVTPEIINSYFDNLQREIVGVEPTNIWNYDESNLVDDPGNKKVITKRGCKYPERIINSTKQSTSIMFCGNALGETLPPYVVYKSTHLYDSWTTGGPDGTRYNRSKSGWFEATIFEDWFEFLLLPRLKKIEGVKLVIGDNLSSHLSVHVLNLCDEHQIKFICLPPNTTHLTQPLDIAYFRPLKIKWRQLLNSYKLSVNNKTISKQDFPRLLRSLTESLAENGKENLKRGFEKAGIYPFNRRKVLERIPGNENIDSEVQLNVSASVIDLLHEKRFSPQTEGTKRRKINVLPGRSIAVSDIQPEATPGPSQVLVADPDEFHGGAVEEPTSNNKSNEDIDIGNFVLFLYENEVYPGQVTQIKSEKNKKSFEIKSLEKSGLYQWKWPLSDDILWYVAEDILEVISTPQPSKRGFFTIKEIMKYK